MGFGDTRPRDVIVALIIFGIIITAGVSILGKVNQYTTLDSQYTEFNDTFNRLEETEAKTSSLRSSLTAQNLPQPLDFLANMYLTAYQTAMSLFNGFEFLDDIMNGLTTMFGVPSWVVSAILSLITIVFTFGALSAFLARDL